jgi:hypothetical protein
VAAGVCEILPRVNPTAVRNIAIIAGIAVLALLWQGVGIIAAGLSQIILVLFVFALAAFGYRYFQQRQLAWLVLSDTQKAIIIGSGIGIALLIIGFPFIAPVLTGLVTVVLIAALALVIFWVLRESQRFR